MVLIKKSSNKGFSFEYVDRTEVRTDIPKSEFVKMQHDNNGSVFDDSQYFLALLSRDNEEENKKALKRIYYQLHTTDYVLDEYRLRDRNENSYLQDVKIILELIKVFYLAAKQKVYEPIINPLNFIFNENTEKVSVFYRKNSFLEEESFIWLDDVKKLLGFFLVSDKTMRVEDFEKVETKDILQSLEGASLKAYENILSFNSIDDMAKGFLEQQDYDKLNSFQTLRESSQTSVKERVKRKNSPVVGVSDKKEPIEQKRRENKKTKTVPSVKPNMKETEQAVNRNKTISMPSNKKIKGLGIVIASIVVIGAFFGGRMSVPAVDHSKEAKATTLAENENFYNGLLSASLQNYEDASKYFDQFREGSQSKELEGKEKTAIYFSYLLNRQYEKALEVDPEGAEGVITFMQSKEEIDKIADINSDNDAIKFEKAVLAQQWDEVINLKDKVKDKPDRQNAVVEALIRTDKLDDAISYVKSKNRKDLKDKMKKIEEDVIEKSDEKEKDKKKKIKEMNKKIDGSLK
ncbi:MULTISPECIES: hypothetical protein [Bacillus]|uniref:Uncharacterized protein n=1 Tax=Bacillus glycinifermentans TaxID=1664069 RepID=A0A0T6BI55_9BACI|nr:MULTISPECIES: hypothetical protein [Bacillus]KRT87127.1 hypothetical protein AB447_209165 [Bacillus glycinifermentans]MEC0341983.1 hypothetical protein [Bacillus sonorensis]MEC0457502.1 hypothetical protein [Bacillus sonorensis]MEC0487179.1 hypothetical protein [Bacillus glycinifermentans]MEC0530703.1 hypothetical protein [Bacillus sonorensis]